MDLPEASAYPSIKIGSRKIDVRELLSIDPTDLVEDYQTTHHWLVCIGYKIQVFQGQIAAKKRELTQVEAGLARRIRSSSEKKLSEAIIKGGIMLDDQYTRLQKEIQDLESAKGIYVVVADGVERKIDMIINMGAELRKRKAIVH